MTLTIMLILVQTHLTNRLTVELGCTNFRLMSDELPCIVEGAPVRIIAAVMVHNEVITEGVAVSSKYAKIKASQRALELLAGLVPFEYRAQYRCNCSNNTVEECDGDLAVAVAERLGGGF